jgi:hypothetical protein
MTGETLELPLASAAPRARHERMADFASELTSFHDFGTATRCLNTTFSANGKEFIVPTFVNEFWTSKQRAASRLQEISYRAYFKLRSCEFY